MPLQRRCPGVGAGRGRRRFGRGSGRSGRTARPRSGRPGRGRGAVAHRRFTWEVVSSRRTTKVKARRYDSLPLSTYSAPEGLRQDPGRAAESAAGPKMDEDMGHDVRVLLSTDGGRGDEPLVGPDVPLRAPGAEVRVCARRPTGRGTQREMRTCRTRGSTLRETPVLRPASAGQRSSAASEVSR